LAVNKKLSKGDTITFNDLESKKPGDQGIVAKEFQAVLGKKLRRDMYQWQFLSYLDLEN